MLAPFVTRPVDRVYVPPVGRLGQRSGRPLDRCRPPDRIVCRTKGLRSCGPGLIDDGLTICGSCGLSGDWLFKLDHPERNG